VAAIDEDTAHSWYAATGRPQHPAEGGTLPVADKDGAYSWCKAPRLGGQVVETGALARQAVAGHPLVRDMIAVAAAASPRAWWRACWRLALVLPRMETWLEPDRAGRALVHHVGSWPTKPPASASSKPRAARSGHWLTVRRGRIHNYQIIAPTTWNFSPRDAGGQPGALEQALAGLPASAEGPLPAAIHHVVRSFDPCMVCTVH
jgi:Ni,Fe-hydrogenase I large subunit